MLKALNPALNFDMTNEQIMQMMNQSGFGMVSMPTTDEQQQQLAVQTQVNMVQIFCGSIFWYLYLNAYVIL